MDGALSVAALIGIVVVIMVGIWIKDKIVDGITTGLTTGINKVVQSGNHHLGKEMIAEEIHATSTATPDEVIKTTLTVLDLPDRKPNTVSAGLFAVRAEDEGVLFGAGGLTGVSFTSMLVVEPTDEGSRIVYTVVEWKIDSGVIAHAKLMSTLSEGVRFALGQVPGIAFTANEGAEPAPAAAVAAEALDVDAIAVANADTDATALADIADRRHDLWDEICIHPSIYPDLHAWIASNQESLSAAQPEPPVVDDPDARALEDTETEAAVLADIAGRRPELWDAVATHPSVYPDLITWIAHQERDALTQVAATAGRQS